jgi:hypothetical protein
VSLFGSGSVDGVGVGVIVRQMSASPESTSDQVVRLPSGRWAPGQAPNPGGRPKRTGAVRNLARQHTEMAISVLADICERGESEAARIAAAVALLDRAWGRPTVAIEMHDNPGPDLGALILEAHRRATEALAEPMAIELAGIDDDPG